MVSGQAAESYFAEDHFPEPVSPKGSFIKSTFHQKGHFAERILLGQFFGVYKNKQCM
jgi:hypothetical protein